MRIRLISIFFFLFTCGWAQDSFDNVGRELFQSDRLYNYEDITFKWTLSGHLQVYLNEGINYLAEKSPEIALKNLNEFVKVDSTFWVAFYYRGVCLKQLGKYRKARKDLLAAVQLNTNSFEATLELAKVCHLIFADNEAEKQYKKAIALKPSDPVPHYLMGDLAFRAGNRRQAVKRYRESLEVDPNFSDSKIKIGLLEVSKSQDGKDMLPYLDEVLKSDTLNKTALSLRAVLNLKYNPIKSIQDFTKLIKLNPVNNLNYRLLRGILYSEAGEFDNAFGDLNRVIQGISADENQFVGRQTNVDKRIDVMNAGKYMISNMYGLPAEEVYKVKSAFCLLLTNRYHESIQVLDNVAGQNKSALCWFLRALALEHWGQHVKAFQCYNQALRFDNDIADAHKKRAIYWTEYKKWLEAEKDFNEVLRIDPSLFLCYKLRAITRFYQNDFVGAEDDFNRYIDNDSTNLEAIESRGMARHKQGKILDAISDFLFSGNFQAVNKKEMSDGIDSVLNLNDTVNAMRYLDTYVKLKPDFLDARCLRIKILISQNRWNTVSVEIKNTMDCVPDIYATPNIYSFLLTAKGHLYEHNGFDEKAISAFSEAINYDKTNVDAYVSRAQVYKTLKKFKMAAKDFESAAKLGSKSAQKALQEF